MRLGGRLAAAIEVLEDIEGRHRPAADALKDWGLSHRFAGAGDRAAIGNIVYDALRRRRSAVWLLDDDAPRAAGFGAIILETAMTPEALNASFDGDRFAPPPLTDDECAAIAARGSETPPQVVRAECPDWCAPHLEESFGEAWVEEGRALARRPPLDLRVNTLRAERDKVAEALEETGARPTRLARHGLRIAPVDGFGRHPNVQVEPAFQKGWFEVQDEGSQVMAQLAGAKPGMQVLDFCAGAGGKTLALAAAMENRGQIHAYDSEKARLAPIFERLRRAECRNVQVISRPGDLSTLAGQMDVVLVDAPCTGSGTWRRRPDAKWRLGSRQLEIRMAEQSAILDDAAAYVRPGGRLVYVTCSVFAQENRLQVAAFVARRPEFAAVDHRSLWRNEYPGHDGEARFNGDAGLSLSPALSDTDGFYFCALRRGD
jgi:16S rRNA (cytosine967-C5)-methyltransferase